MGQRVYSPGMRGWFADLFRRRPTPKKKTEERRGTGAALFGAGALELQALLQPDRKVEIILEQVKEPDQLEPSYRPAWAGDGDPPPDSP